MGSTPTRPRVRQLERETLEQDPSSVFVVSPDFRLLYVNPAYRAFWKENGGEPRDSRHDTAGANVLDAINGDARRYYEEKWAQAMQSSEPWHHEYLCPSPTFVRECRQSAYPVKEGLVLVNSILVTRPAVSDDLAGAVTAHESGYRAADGMITQCTNCRRTQRSDGSSVWDWIPAWVAHMPNDTSHSICPVCFDYHWK